VLDDLARQVGAAVHAVRLSTDLQHSRERLVTAREEERRRLGRELHDGLGPQLAGLTMKVEAARELIASRPDRAETLLLGLADQAEAAVADLRRMAYLLRPPALDTLGLLEALRSHAAQQPLDVRVIAPPDLPPLPAAVEVAVYRIAVEALRNVVRHAGARRCSVLLAIGAGGLTLEVVDDGRGLAPGVAGGVGLSSMRERAAELGGRGTVEPGPGGGTRVVAELPCVLPPVASGPAPVVAGAE
jgi:signal transduction histidine kinase